MSEQSNEQNNEQNSEQENIFRKTSIDSISSPEKLNDYIKVSNPAVWIILAAIAALLVGGLVWASTYELTPDGLTPFELMFSKG